MVRGLSGRKETTLPSLEGGEEVSKPALIIVWVQAATGWIWTT
jgi:hypothetical protein